MATQTLDDVNKFHSRANEASTKSRNQKQNDRWICCAASLLVVSFARWNPIGQIDFNVVSFFRWVSVLSVNVTMDFDLCRVRQRDFHFANLFGLKYTTWQYVYLGVFRQLNLSARKLKNCKIAIRNKRRRWTIMCSTENECIFSLCVLCLCSNKMTDAKWNRLFRARQKRLNLCDTKRRCDISFSSDFSLDFFSTLGANGSILIHEKTWIA